MLFLYLLGKGGQAGGLLTELRLLLTLALDRVADGGEPPGRLRGGAARGIESIQDQTTLCQLA